MGLISPSQAHDAVAPKGKEKCYGIVPQGQNDCANLSGTHSCAGMAAADRLPDEWKLVPKGSCAKLGGKLEAQARQALREAAVPPMRPTGPAN